MKLVFALGNNGPEYAGTRHNIGFDVLDRIATGMWHEKPKFKALVSEKLVNGEKVIFAKPLTFYNVAGESFRAIADFYKLPPTDVLIVHDDLALELGTIRVRVGGSDGGNNGIKSINAHGGEATYRLRIGMHTDLRSRIGDDAAFVLGKLSQAEHKVLASRQADIAHAIDCFISETLTPHTLSL